jgi:alpha-1,2-mannosyltransferase
VTALRIRLRAPGSARTIIVLANVIGLGLLLTLTRYHLDLDVYRLGVRTWLSGGDLYGPLPLTASGVRLPFIYPPAAAVLLSPLALPPLAVAGVLLTVLSAALLGVTLLVFTSALGMRDPAWWAAALLPVALLLEPVWATLHFGQVNILLMVLVAVDCLAPRPVLPRGLLVGLAAAIKLTPIVFVLFFLLRGDRRAALYACLSALVGTAVGFVIAPGESVRYWTSTVFVVSGMGSPGYAGNQSIKAVLERLGFSGTGALWLIAVTAVAVACVLTMRRALHADRPQLALVVNAIAGLLVSPVSWTHHWVWIAPAVLVFAVYGLRDRDWSACALAAVGLLLFVLAPQWWFSSGDGRELHWTVWRQLLGNAYVWYGIAVVAWPTGTVRR